MRRHHIHLLILFGVILLGFWLRTHYLDRSMRFDEALTYMEYASRDIPSIVADYSEPNNHIFNTLLMHLAALFFGNHPTIIRLPAWIPGVLAIPLAYEVARRLFNRGAGLMAAGWVAVSPSLVDLSVNARGYSLQGLFTLLLLWLGLRGIERNKGWLLFALVSALGFLTIPTFLYPMGAVALWLLLVIWRDSPRYRRRVLLKNFVVALVVGAVLTLVFYAPVILFSGLDKLIANPYVQPLPPEQFYERAWENYAAFAGYMHRWLPLMAVALLILGAVVGTAANRRISRYGVPLLLPALAWITVVLLVQRVFPYPRTIAPLMPLYFIAAGAGLALLLQRRRYFIEGVTVLVCVLVSVGLVSSNYIITSDETGYAGDAEQAAFYFAENVGANEVIYYSYPSNYAVRYYEQLHGLNTIEKADANNPRTFIYYHSQEERERLLAAMRDLDAAYTDAAFEPVHEFPHSTFEQVITEN